MGPETLELARRVGERTAQRMAEISASESGSPHHSDGLAAAVAETLDDAMERLSVTGMWGPENRMASNEFWDVAEPWLRHGDLQVHARLKPRGYAGDFELLRKICDGVCCTHPLGWAMDSYFQGLAAPCAVRCRVALIADRIVELCHESSRDQLKIVSVGSGPGIELRRALQQLPAGQRARIRLTLLDLDQQALDFAVQSLTTLLGPEQITALRANLSRLPDHRRMGDAISGADYLFCLGFFDYLDQSAAQEMLTAFYRALAPGGELAVFNFAAGNTSRAYMEWIGNWYLIYRDAADMGEIATQIAQPEMWVASSLAEGTIIRLSMYAGS